MSDQNLCWSDIMAWHFIILTDNVYLTKRQLDEVLSGSANRPTKLFRSLLGVFFDLLTLSASSALGSKINPGLNRDIIYWRPVSVSLLYNEATCVLLCSQALPWDAIHKWQGPFWWTQQMISVHRLAARGRRHSNLNYNHFVYAYFDYNWIEEPHYVNNAKHVTTMNKHVTTMYFTTITVSIAWLLQPSYQVVTTLYNNHVNCKWLPCFFCMGGLHIVNFDARKTEQSSWWWDV